MIVTVCVCVRSHIIHKNYYTHTLFAYFSPLFFLLVCGALNRKVNWMDGVVLRQCVRVCTAWVLCWMWTRARFCLHFWNEFTWHMHTFEIYYRIYTTKYSRQIIITHKTYIKMCTDTARYFSVCVFPVFMLHWRDAVRAAMNVLNIGVHEKLISNLIAMDYAVFQRCIFQFVESETTRATGNTGQRRGRSTDTRHLNVWLMVFANHCQWIYNFNFPLHTTLPWRMFAPAIMH